MRGKRKRGGKGDEGMKEREKTNKQRERGEG